MKSGQKNRFDYEGARQYALQRLQSELSPRLIYHSLEHTRDDVVPATERLARLEGVTGEDLLLLLTAANYHDLGFIQVIEGDKSTYQRRTEHEAASIHLAKEVLPGFGYTSADLQVIEGMILATRLPQTPQTLWEAILADADLDSLGREDYWPTSFALRQELAAFGVGFSDEVWFQSQLHFLQGHSYFTATARHLRDAQKQRNIAALQERLRILGSI